MPNPKGNESSLVKYKPKWRSGKTRTIRVPIAISDLVLEAAREIDVNGNKSLVTVIKQLKDKIERLEAGSAVISYSSQIKENSKQPHPKDGDPSTDTSETEIVTNEDRVIRGKISEVVAILQHGITPKSQGGVYLSNNAKSLKQEVVRAIAILEGLTGNRVIHGKISEVVVILQHGITSKSQGGVYRTNNAKSLKEEVSAAIAILEGLTGLENIESYVASNLQLDSDSNDTRQYTHSEVAKIVEAGRSTVGKYHEIFRGGEPTGKSTVAKRIKDAGFRPSETHEHRWIKVK